MQRPSRFFCAGSLNVDITFPVERLPEEHEKLRCDGAHLSHGGSAANTAHWLARLGHATAMLGCVGEDAFGRQAVQALATAGVDTAYIQYAASAATGLAAIFASPAGKRMVTSGGANAHFDPAGLPASLFGPDSHLHVATPLRAIALPLLQQAKANGASTSCDLDQGPDAELLPLLDICFINHSDLARWLGTDDPAEAWQRLSAPPGFTLVMTQGAQGATAVSHEGSHSVTAQEVLVRDRTGGGDAFDAGYLHGLAQGLDRAACLQQGLRLAACVIASFGTRPLLRDG